MTLATAPVALGYAALAAAEAFQGNALKASEALIGAGAAVATMAALVVTLAAVALQCAAEALSRSALGQFAWDAGIVACTVALGALAGLLVAVGSTSQPPLPWWSVRPAAVLGVAVAVDLVRAMQRRLAFLLESSNAPQTLVQRLLRRLRRRHAWVARYVRAAGMVEDGSTLAHGLAMGLVYQRFVPADHSVHLLVQDLEDIAVAAAARHEPWTAVFRRQRPADRAAKRGRHGSRGVFARGDFRRAAADSEAPTPVVRPRWCWRRRVSPLQRRRAIGVEEIFHGRRTECDGLELDERPQAEIVSTVESDELAPAGVDRRRLLVGEAVIRQLRRHLHRHEHRRWLRRQHAGALLLAPGSAARSPARDPPGALGRGRVERIVGC